MATQGEEFETTFEASGDLSSDQYKFVQLAADGQVEVVGTLGNLACGVLQNDPDAEGKAATVRFGGATKVEAGETINEGDPIGSNASGQAVHAETAAEKILGIALEAASSGEVFKIAFDLAGEVA